MADIQNQIANVDTVTGRPKQAALLGLARAVEAANVHRDVKNVWLRQMLFAARRVTWDTHVVIYDCPVLDDLAPPGGSGTEIADADAACSEFALNVNDCIYVDFPSYAFSLYTEDRFETGALKRSDAIKRIGTSGSGLITFLRRARQNDGGMSWQHFRNFCQMHGYPKATREHTRKLIDDVRTWWKANRYRTEFVRTSEHQVWPEARFRAD